MCQWTFYRDGRTLDGRNEVVVVGRKGRIYRPFSIQEKKGEGGISQEDPLLLLLLLHPLLLLQLLGDSISALRRRRHRAKLSFKVRDPSSGEEKRK